MMCMGGCLAMTSGVSNFQAIKLIILKQILSLLFGVVVKSHGNSVTEAGKNVYRLKSCHMTFFYNSISA